VRLVCFMVWFKEILVWKAGKNDVIKP